MWASVGRWIRMEGRARAEHSYREYAAAGQVCWVEFRKASEAAEVGSQN